MTGENAVIVFAPERNFPPREGGCFLQDKQAQPIERGEICEAELRAVGLFQQVARVRDDAGRRASGIGLLSGRRKNVRVQRDACREKQK